ncbi:multidrug effflux MFS transporter [Leifsonia sp. NPDC058194]|uniref:multidrug effflux MFS transporter n=1 Tax=Leifsonia sp. NPDC058194 TaxID=3346374 RepID=UPI0036DDD9E6
MRPAIRRPYFPALLLVAATGALSTDTYVAALPRLAADLGVSSSVAQLTMTACIAGMAVGQLMGGSWSDARGRRGLIVTSSIAFAALSIVCAVATSAWLLIIARLFQGIACGVGAAVGRAVVTDVWFGREAAARFGTLTAVGLIAPVAGPAIGGALLTFGDWRTVFWFLVLLGVVMVIGATTGIPETLLKERRHPGGFASLVARARDLLTDRAFVVPVIVQCFTTGGFFVYIGGSSFVLQEDLGISQQLYSVVFAVNAVAMMISSILFRLLVGRFGAFALRRLAIGVQSLAVAALLTVTLISPGHQPPLAAVWTCLGVMTFGLGTYLPSNSSITQEAGRRSAGTASALGGGIPFLVGACTTPLTGLIGSETVLVMASLMAALFACAILAAIMGARTRRG